MSLTNQVALVRQPKTRRIMARRSKSQKGKVSKLLKDVSRLKKEVLSTEVKSVYNAFLAAQIDNTGSVSFPINIPIQGSQVFSRVGRAAKCTGIDFRYHVTANSSVTAAAIRVIVYLDKKNILPAVTDVLLSNPAGFTLGTSRACLSYYNRNNRNDFQVLYDQIHDFDFSTGDFQAYKRVHLKTNHILKFIDDSTTIAENSVRVLMISDQGLASAARPTIEWVTAYYYTDN